MQAKLEGGEVKAPEEPKKSTGEVVDLLAALQRSVDAAKTSRGEKPAAKAESAEDDKPAKKTAKKAAAKKAPAKKTAKKTTKKAAAKKAS